MAELQTSEHLRLAPARLFAHYFEKRAESLAFYRRVRRRGVPPPIFTREYVLYHSWLPGFLELDAHTSSSVRAWIHDDVRAYSLPSDLTEKLASRGWCEAAASPQLDQLLEKAFTVFPAIQNPKELRLFLDEIAARRPRTVVEIGTAAGGVLYCVSQLSDPEALLVSIDSPEGLYGESQDDEECALFSTFVGARQRLEFIRDRSFHYSTKSDLAALLNGRKVDVLFIDGDHSYGGAKSDFEMYSEFVERDGLIAFHDILMFPETWGRGFDVAILWRELSALHSTREITDPDAPRRPPLPELAERFGMPALGFGLVFWTTS
jgi:predicted O-methyltransferase YrrM